MYWLDNDSGVTTPPAIPPVVSATRKWFTEGGAGEQPSWPGGEWFNMMTDEVLAVLAAAGIAPDKANHTQLVAALAAMFPNKTAFAASLATNGYQKLSSGLIIQWGFVTFSGTVAANTQYTLTTTYPLAFPGASFFACASCQDHNGGIDTMVQNCRFAGPLTSFALTFRSTTPGTANGTTFRWYAIGA